MEKSFIFAICWLTFQDERETGWILSLAITISMLGKVFHLCYFAEQTFKYAKETGGLNRSGH